MKKIETIYIHIQNYTYNLQNNNLKFKIMYIPYHSRINSNERFVA